MMDSTDFHIKGKCSVHKDKASWSHKLHSPGRCWVSISNVKGQTQWVSSAYLPTVYDSDIIIANSGTLDSLFSGLEMVGDNHFRKAAPFLKKVTFHTNIARSGRPKVVNGKKIPVELNRKISLVRGKIEAPYGWAKRIFLCLDRPFYESEKQHNCVVCSVLACHHLTLGKQ